MNDKNQGGNATLKKQKTSWHRLLARLLEMILSPLDIDVQSDVSVMTDPPEADILLLRRKTPRWTTAQRERLPDAIRDSEASHILIEFKYTQSFNEEALQQALGYDFFYKQAKQLTQRDVQTVLLSARKPHAETLRALGYQVTEYPGVYRSQHAVIKKVLLLSLNELSNEPHNVWIKCFASRKNVKKQALNKLKELDLVSIANDLKWFISGLMEVWFAKGEEKMSIEMTPEEVTELGKQLGEIWLANLTVDELLARFGREEVLSHFKPKPEEVLPHFKLEVIEDYLKKVKRQ
ncbi:MAG: hypothetical protein VSS75_017580 [Candidatus Parabeggiatoa sp.]|nr:hypothetical protein [Candidatus Parabeggiatoa sp.]